MASGSRLGTPGSSQYVPGEDARAIRVRCRGRYLVVTLEDGRIVQVPRAWYDRLARATPAQLRRHEIFSEGRFIYFPAIDEDVSVARLLAPPCAACLERLRHEHGVTRRKVARSAARVHRS